MSNLRLIVPGVPNHLILRGNNRRKLFSYPWEYRQFLRFVREASEKHECPLHVASLMPNHAHLVPTPPTVEAASRFVQSFAQRYARLRNIRRGGSGKLFEERFSSFPILTEQYLAVVTAYIELNPVRAGLCDHPREWPWSTYRLHVGRADLSDVPYRMWTPSPWFLELGENRFRVYADWVAECRERDSARETREPERRVRRPNESRAT